MKKSSIAIFIFILIYIAAAITCDYVLASKYKTIDLSDPFRNFTAVPIHAFAYLNITGGNGYAIEVRQGKDYSVMLMNSRKSFFSMKQSGDTLNIRFMVANQSYQSPQHCTVGLVITAPDLRQIKLSGTNTIIGPFKGDSAEIIQGLKTFTRVRGLHYSKLSLVAVQESVIDLEVDNHADRLSIQANNKAAVVLNGISFREFLPVIRDSARLTFFRDSYGTLKKW